MPAPSTASPPPIVAVAIPTLQSSRCDLREQPTHRLAFTTDGVTLDGAPLPGPSISDVIPALRALARTDREVTLAIDAELALDDLRPLLASLSEVDDLRLYVSLHIGEDPQVRHLPIGTPQLGAPRLTSTARPPNTYLHEITHHARVGRPRGPSSQDFDPRSQQLLVYGARINWGDAVRGLARACDGAILIDPPLSPPEHEWPRSPYVKQGTPRITDAHDGVDVDPVVHVLVLLNTRHADIDDCYTQALTRDRDTRGRVTLAFTIGPAGKVVAATAYENTSGDVALGACVAAVARRWKFQHRPGGRDVSVVLPYEFTSR